MTEYLYKYYAMAISCRQNSTETSKASREVVIMMMIMKRKGKAICSFEGGSNNSVTSPLQVQENIVLKHFCTTSPLHSNAFRWSCRFFKHVFMILVTD